MSTDEGNIGGQSAAADSADLVSFSWRLMSAIAALYCFSPSMTIFVRIVVSLIVYTSVRDNPQVRLSA